MNSTWLSLRYSSALPMRILLILAALLCGVLFIAQAGQLAEDPDYKYLFRVATPLVWSLVFATDAIALAWRTLERRSRIGWTRLINSLTCALWIAYLVCMVHGRNYLAPDGAIAVALVAGALWCTFRTDLTVSDRENA